MTPSIQNSNKNPMALLDVEHLRVEFPTRRNVLVAVDDVSFFINKGEVLGVVGESGAGKSITGLAIIGLLERPGRIARGTIRLEGEKINGLPKEAMRRIRGAKIGAIFQDPLTSLNPLYTIGRQLVQTIKIHTDLTLDQARNRAIDLLSEVGIPAARRRFDAYPHEFSGGMRQRVVVALALCANPQLIIADEPVSALDVSIQAQVINLLDDLKDEFNLSYVFISHDLSVVEHICDRIAVMYLGTIVELATTEKFSISPRHPYTRALLLAVPLPDPHRKTEPFSIEGDVPSPIDPPSGCAFHPRCPYRFDRCPKEKPPLIEAGPGHLVACWLNRGNGLENDE